MISNCCKMWHAPTHSLSPPSPLFFEQRPSCKVKVTVRYGRREEKKFRASSFLPSCSLGCCHIRGLDGGENEGRNYPQFPPLATFSFPPISLKRPHNIFLMMPTHMSFAYLGNTRCDLCVMRGEKKIKSGEILSRFFLFLDRLPIRY